jgi:hypothetical protein
MAVEARYTEQIVFQDTPETATELMDLSDAARVSRAEIVRRCVEVGLPTIRKQIRDGQRKQAGGAAA